jgi:Planctomycete cytochrome C
MASFRLKQTIISLLGIVVVSAVLVQCTKDNVNASLIDRDLPSVPDSSVFAPFYDTVVIDQRDPSSGFNDTIKTAGVQSIISNYCASPSCHGGNIKPKLTTYAEIKSLVVPGNPEGSQLMELITTSDLAKSMPPVNYGSDLSTTEKTKIYNWIRNGAKERPDLADYRPAAVAMIVIGCGSANCHNQATAGGYWARNKFLNIAPTDTVNFTFTDANGTFRNYAQLKEPKLSEVWNAYKDSVKKFYTDTVANASFRPYKTFSRPIATALPSTTSGFRAPLGSYDDYIMDIKYPKGVRNLGTVQYTDANGKRFYVKGNYLDNTSSLIYQIDSTVFMMNPYTKVWGTSVSGRMSWDDGGLTKSDIALVKAWYFADPNIPDVWKYGTDGAGIFKYKRTGNVIKK